MISELARSAFFHDPKEEGYLYLVDDKLVAHLVPHDEPQVFCVFWRGRVRLQGMLDFVARMALDAGSLQAARTDTINTAEVTYVRDHSLFEFEVAIGDLLNPSTDHGRFMSESGERIRFARYDLKSEEPVILWADVVHSGSVDPEAPTEAGFGGTIAPDTMFEFFRYSVRETLTNRDYAILQEHIQRRVAQFTDTFVGADR